MNKCDFHLGKRIEALTFALPFKREQRLPDSIMAVQLILVQFVLVRIQVGQQETHSACCGFWHLEALRMKFA